MSETSIQKTGETTVIAASDGRPRAVAQFQKYTEELP